MTTLWKTLIRVPRVTGLISSLRQQSLLLQRNLSETANPENEQQVTVYDDQVSEDTVNFSRVKFTMPGWAVPAFIGTGGENIKEVTRKCQTNIILSNFQEYFPGTKERVVMIEGESKNILQTVHEVHDFFRSLQPPENLEQFDAARRRQRGINLVIPTSLCGEFIGNKAETAKQIHRQFKLDRFNIHGKLYYLKYSGLNETLVFISGEEKNVKEAIEYSVEKLRAGPKVDENLSYRQFYGKS